MHSGFNGAADGLCVNFGVNVNVCCKALKCLLAFMALMLCIEIAAWFHSDFALDSIENK